MIEIDQDLDIILSIILDTQKTYIKYIDQAKKAYNQCDKIWIYIWVIEQDFHICNEEREHAISLLIKILTSLKNTKR